MKPVDMIMCKKYSVNPILFCTYFDVIHSTSLHNQTECSWSGWNWVLVKTLNVGYETKPETNNIGKYYEQ